MEEEADWLLEGLHDVRLGHGGLWTAKTELTRRGRVMNQNNRFHDRASRVGTTGLGHGDNGFRRKMKGFPHPLFYFPLNGQGVFVRLKLDQVGVHGCKVKAQRAKVKPG